MDFLSAGVHKHAHSAHAQPTQNGLIAYAASSSLLLYDPLRNRVQSSTSTISTMMSSNKDAKVQCVRWLDSEMVVCGDSKGTLGVYALMDRHRLECVERVHVGADAIHHISSLSLPINSDASLSLKSMVLISATCGPSLVIYALVKPVDTENWSSKLIKVQEVKVEAHRRGVIYPLCSSLSLLLSSASSSSVQVVLALGATDQLIHIYSTSLTHLLDLTNESKDSFATKAGVLRGHADWVRDLAFMTIPGNGAILASAGQDRYIRLWHFTHSADNPQQQAIKQEDDDQAQGEDDEEKWSTSRELGSGIKVRLDSVLMGHEDVIFGLDWYYPTELMSVGREEWDTKNVQLVSCSADKTVIIWYPTEPDAHNRSSHPNINEDAGVLGEDGEEVCGEWGVWTSRAQLGDLGGTSHGIYNAFWYESDLEELRLMTTTYYGAIQQYAIPRDMSGEIKPLGGLTGHFGPVVDLTWDPTRTYLLSSSTDQTTRAWIPTTALSREEKGTAPWIEIARCQIHGYDMTSLAPLGTSGSHFASCSEGEKVIRVFEAPGAFLDMVERYGVQSDVEVLKSAADEDGRSGDCKAALAFGLGLSNKAIRDDDKDAKKKAAVDAASNPERAQLEEITRTHLLTSQSTLRQASTMAPLESHLQSTLWPELDKLYGHGDEIYSINTSRDRMCLVSSCVLRTSAFSSVNMDLDESSIRIWDVVKADGADLKVVPGHPLDKVHNMTVTRVCFSWSGALVAMVGRDRSITLHRVFRKDDKTGLECLFRLKDVHSRVIWDAAVTFDDRFICTVSRDKYIKMFRIVDGKELVAAGSLKMEDSVRSIDVLPVATLRGEYLLAVGLESGKISVLSAKEQILDPNDSEGAGKAVKISVVHTFAEHWCPGGAVTRLQFRVLVPQKSEDEWAVHLKGEFADRVRLSDVPEVSIQVAACAEDQSVRVLRVPKLQ